MATSATLIGDLVNSRGSADRRALHDHLTATLAATWATLAGELRLTAPLQITVGDEFQGGFRSLGAALQAALLIRVGLRVAVPEADLRCGIGQGVTHVLDQTTGIQDGPGWWQARDAIEEAEALGHAPSTRTVRTRCRLGDDDRRLEAAVNAALGVRDQLISTLDDRSIRILDGLLRGQAKQDIAAAEGISASAVSQRAHRSGLDAIVEAAALLRRL